MGWMAGRSTTRLLVAGLIAALVLGAALLIWVPNLRDAAYWSGLRDAVLGRRTAEVAAPERAAEVPAEATAPVAAATAAAVDPEPETQTGAATVPEDTSKLDVLPGPYRNLPTAAPPFALQPDIRYLGRLGLEDLPPDVLPSSVEEALQHAVDSAQGDESLAEAEAEAAGPMRRENKIGAEVCASEALQAGQRALMRRRQFLLPWVRRGDLVMIQGEFPDNAFQRAKLSGKPLKTKAEVSMSVHGPLGAYFHSSLDGNNSLLPKDKEQLSLVFKAEQGGVYKLTVDLDDCTAAVSVPYRLQVSRRGAATAAAASAEAVAPERSQTLPMASLPQVELGHTYQGALLLDEPLKGAYSPSGLYSTLFQDMHIGPLVKGKRYLIEVTSPDADPALQLFQRGPLVGDTAPQQDSDGGAHGNAMLIYQPKLDGPYILRVVGTDPRDIERANARFGYQVRVSEWTP